MVARKNTGDGVGILLQMPHKFFLRICQESNILLPPLYRYGSGLVFLPNDSHQSKQCQEIFEKIIDEEGQQVLGWRDLPTDDSSLGLTARSSEPIFRQIFIGRSNNIEDEDVFERKLYIIRKRVEHAVFPFRTIRKRSFLYSFSIC